MRRNIPSMFHKAKRLSIRSLVTGRASPKGTQDFITKSKISLFHKLNTSSLMINPIITLPSSQMLNIPLDFQFKLYYTALNTYRSNCLFIYKDNGIDQEWHFKGTDKLLSTSKIPRDNVLLAASIGVSIYPFQDISQQLDKIKALCEIEHIDIVVLEVSNKLNV